MAAQVVFNRPLETVYHYLVPDSLRELIAPGQRVQAPFGRGGRLSIGFCVGLCEPQTTTQELKTLHAVLEREPLLSTNMLRLTRWIAERYLCGWGQVLNMVLPAGVKKQAGTRVVQFFRAAPEAAENLNELGLPPKQQAVLQVLVGAPHPLRVDDLTSAAGCGTGPLNALRKKGLVQAIRERTSPVAGDGNLVEPVDDLILNADQRGSLDPILAALRSREHRTFLLHGVTGSGKTEVYIQAIREVVGYGQEAIVLVPEISLTPQTIRRFRSRFDRVAVLHSRMSDADRHWHWQQIARGGVQVVVGARSAIFAPTPNLGLIVIDEEHETTFKQETTPRYHAREVARQRARLERIPLILGSATPTLESWLRVQQEKDTLLSLPSRVEKRPLPPVVVVDVRNDPQCSRGAAVGRALESAMRLALNDGGQIILLLNLRGFSPLLWCRACGESVKCPSCDVTLTWHKDRKIALCHFCDFHATAPTNCPGCGHAGMRYFGTGTQRLEQEVQARFPEATVLRMDSDSMRKPGSHDAALDAFRHGDVQILLGTQMIAKGLDFPDVTLVGVVDADTSLHQPDPRSTERTFQLISQVAGRTGRGPRGGRVFVQTSSPAEPAILMAAEHDYLAFAAFELEHRRRNSAPPFHHLMRVVVRGPNEAAAEQQAEQMTHLLKSANEANGSPVRILGPAPTPLAKLKGNYRYHFQLAAAQLAEIQQLWRETVDEFPRKRDIDFTVDVDPLDMR